jgi:hypothetical protein
MAPSVFDKYRIVLLASEGLSMGQIDVDLLAFEPCLRSWDLPIFIYPTHMRLTD